MSSLSLPSLSRSSRRTLSFFAASSALSLFALTLAAPAAQAQADLSFTGGGGSPLQFTLASPVSYTITTAASSPLNFLFDGVADSIITAVPLVGSITYSVGGGPDQTINFLLTGLAFGDVTANDIMISGPASENVSVGTVVVLKAGSMTTAGNYNGATPTSGSSITTFIVANTVRISSNGVEVQASAAPEPGTLALLALGGLPLAGAVLRRRSA